jgi:hypothetical protein
MTSPDRTTLRRRTLIRSVGEGFRSRKGTLDIIIPVASKDSPCLEQVLAAARKNLRHRIAKIYIVYRERPEGRIARARDVVLVDEREVAPVPKSRITYRPRGVDRSGWIFQQLIKLSCDQICTSEHILVLDSDTVLMRPQRLIKNGRVVLNVSDERHAPYYQVIERLLPGTAIYPYSFVSHHMLFTKSFLREMKARLERSGKPWFQAILDAIDPQELSGFAEYELYGNYMTAYHPKSVRVEHFLNQGFAADWVRRLWYVKLRYPLNKSASFHSR